MFQSCFFFWQWWFVFPRAYVCVDACMFVWCMCVYDTKYGASSHLWTTKRTHAAGCIRFSLLNFNIYTLNVYKTYASVIQSG